MSQKSAIKRGLVLAKYDTRAATTRQRFMQAIPYLREAGIEIEISPLFDNAYLDALFDGGTRNISAIMAAYGKRFQAVLRARNYDFIWVQYELFPYLPGRFERLIGLANKPVVYDMDDALFHQYDQHQNPLIRWALGQKLVPLLQRSQTAFCGNAYLQNYVRNYCARSEIIPTTLDITRYVPTKKSPTSRPVVGWIGSPSTWKFCASLTPTFTALVEAKTMSMRVVGAQHAANHSLPFEFRDWVEANEINDIQGMDIGIMPLPDAPWARGKCGYKLIQYMACGLPVIASPVGVNAEIVQHGVNGFLATTDDEWRIAINTLARDPELRNRMGAAGRARVEQHYSIQQYGPRMAKLILETTAKKP
jgi:glycosyltransferase involved in cell wall biosynthesis